MNDGHSSAVASFFPSRSKRIFRLTGTVLLLCLFCAATLAGDDVQQTTDEEARRAVKQADKLIRKGEFAEAEKILRLAAERHPLGTDVKLSLSYVLFKQRRFRESYDISFAVAQAEPKNARAFALVGVALASYGNFSDAKLLLNNAVALDDREPLAWAAMGMIDFYENRIDQSWKKLSQAEIIEPNEPDFTFTLAQVLARAEMYREAADAYQRFLDISPTTDTDRRERIKGLISFLRYIGSKQKLYVVDKIVPRTVVPFEMINYRPVIEVKIGKRKEPFRFVLDTGSGISVISDEAAQRLKLKPVARGGKARAVGGDGKFDIVYGFIKSVGLGGVSISNVPVYIRKFHGNQENIDGYIGLALISKFLTTVDYGNSTFTLTKKSEGSVEQFEKEAVALPLRLTSSGFLSGEVQLTGIEPAQNFIVDTGASISVISDELANTEELSPFLTGEKMRVVGAAGITDNVQMYLIPKVSFGSHSSEGIKAVALDLNVINEAAGFRQNGILGGNFLKNYRVTFDFKNSRVTFVPVKKTIPAAAPKTQ